MSALQQQKQPCHGQSLSPTEQRKLDEATARIILAVGIPPNAPSCGHHGSQLANINLEEYDMKNGTAIPLMNMDWGLLNETFTQETALLPYCYTCISNAQNLQPNEPPRVVDECTCASAITSATCWYCKAGIVERSKLLHIQQRGVHLPSGKVVLTCNCGNEMRGPEGARQCAACYGIVTAIYIKSDDQNVTPVFKNLAGNGIVFETYTANVRKCLLQPTPAFLANKVQTQNAKPSSANNSQWDARRSQELANRGDITVLDIMHEVDGREQAGISKSNNHAEASKKNPTGFESARARPDMISANAVSIFTDDQLRSVQGLSLQCQAVRCDPKALPTPFTRAQIVLKMNPKTMMSPSTLTRLFEICGVEKNDIGGIFDNLKSHKLPTFPSGDEVALLLSARGNYESN